jgi:hypothetical protein
MGEDLNHPLNLLLFTALMLLIGIAAAEIELWSGGAPQQGNGREAD